jgi:16S rRNA (guanine527-N7)-methyltransferase
MNLPFELMLPTLKEKGISVDDTALLRLEKYAQLLVEWNEKINLTAITDPQGIVIKHFLDCALLLSKVDLPQGAKVVDVGTGAGFPGMVLKILRPDIQLTVLDGLNKRLVFLNEVLNQLGLEATTVHLRAEEAGKKSEFRENFHLVTARAVAELRTLYEYCLPLCKIGGSFCAMKGPSATEELKNAGFAAKILGGNKAKISTSTLTGEEVRTFVVTKKISQPPPKYPRASAKISKQPL